MYGGLACMARQVAAEPRAATGVTPARASPAWAYNKMCIPPFPALSVPSAQTRLRERLWGRGSTPFVVIDHLCIFGGPTILWGSLCAGGIGFLARKPCRVLRARSALRGWGEIGGGAPAVAAVPRMCTWPILFPDLQMPVSHPSFPSSSILGRWSPTLGAKFARL